MLARFFNFVKFKLYKYQIGWNKSEQCNLFEIADDRLVGMESLDEMTNQISNKSKWSDDGFLFIGSTLANHVLLKTKNGNDYGKIYFQHRDKLEYDFVAEDIFDFFRKMVLIPDNETLEDLEVNMENLYKNWGEGFWRVREDKIA